MTVSDFSEARPDVSATGLRSKWGWFVALGIALLFLGCVAFGNLVLATVASVYYLGAMMLVGGIFQIVHAFGVKPWSNILFWSLSGVLYTIAGIVTFSNPLLASAVLTLVVAISLIVAGIFRVVVGVQSRSEAGWGWIVAAGIITSVAGLIVAFGWPVNSLIVLGLILAIDLIFQGWAAIIFGFDLRR